ncbi:hypothetical protein GCM10010174_61220 [Kutzneria viridogrisea]|uniref:CcmD family protein n=1 Tax=Kutzneria viridogrisea TaxID=47990 RepID=A0ABR6BGF3_9PSEU|nr:hypothetical protein [Kutzneria viridogrisea]
MASDPLVPLYICALWLVAVLWTVDLVGYVVAQWRARRTRLRQTISTVDAALVEERDGDA